MKHILLQSSSIGDNGEHEANSSENRLRQQENVKITRGCLTAQKLHKTKNSVVGELRYYSDIIAVLNDGTHYRITA